MDFFESLGVLIPLAPFIMVGIIVWSKNQAKLAQLRLKETASDTAERAAQYASQVAQLEDRVRVLERIVTDGGYDVATQIEALRDQRRVEGGYAGVPLDSLHRERA